MNSARPPDGSGAPSSPVRGRRSGPSNLQSRLSVGMTSSQPKVNKQQLTTSISALVSYRAAAEALLGGASLPERGASQPAGRPLSQPKACSTLLTLLLPNWLKLEPLVGLGERRATAAAAAKFPLSTFQRMGDICCRLNSPEPQPEQPPTTTRLRVFK